MSGLKITDEGRTRYVCFNHQVAYLTFHVIFSWRSGNPLGRQGMLVCTLRSNYTITGTFAERLNDTTYEAYFPLSPSLLRTNNTITMKCLASSERVVIALREIPQLIQVMPVEKHHKRDTKCGCMTSDVSSIPDTWTQIGHIPGMQYICNSTVLNYSTYLDYTIITNGNWALYDEELNSKTETQVTFLPCPLSYMESVRKKGPKRLRLGAGFYENRSWVSSQGRSWRSTKQVFMCLRNRTIYFHGDSTVRQWHEAFESALKMADPNTKRMSDSSRFRASFYSPHFNITTNFSFIEFPVARANFSVNENQFGHRLDEIAQPEDVVLIGAGMAHRAFGGVVEGMKQVEYYTQLAKRCARRCASVSYKSSTFRGREWSGQTRVGNAVFNSLYLFVGLTSQISMKSRRVFGP